MSDAKSNDKPIFYMLVGMPGSGKSTFVKELLGDDDNKIITSNSMVINHDAIVKENMIKMGKNKAKEVTHNYIVKILKELKSEHPVIYDSVNGSSEGRSFFMNCVPNHYKKIIIFFSPSLDIINDNYETYVKTLLSIRSKHNLFPTDPVKACKTLSNIKNGFESITVKEKELFDVINKRSYL